VSDIDIAVVDRLKALDPKRPIREADIISPALKSASRMQGSEKICSSSNRSVRQFLVGSSRSISGFSRKTAFNNEL
jgi:hypothetical protein